MVQNRQRRAGHIDNGQHRQHVGRKLTAKPQTDLTVAGENTSRRLFVYNGGFLTGKRIRRILELAGWSVKLGKPGPGDWVGVWGRSPTSPRGETVAAHTDSPLLRVEDAFLRSVLPGRDGDDPIGLCLDTRGVHFDSSTPSDLEHLLATHPLDDTALLDRARDGAERLRRAHLSKYNAFDPKAPLPEAPYVLVIDQTRGDASVEFGQANEATFKEMLVFAQTEHPGNRVIIKSHPETLAGHREGYFSQEDAQGRVSLLGDPVSPWALLEGATAVYTVSSQLGFEAIYAGHKPRVFGQPFYAGWGLTQDEYPVARRERKLTRAQLFAAAMILYPTWYDPNRDRLCAFEDATDALEAQARAWREDHLGYTASGMRLWKRPHIKAFFGRYAPVHFGKSGPPGARHMVWGAGEKDDNAVHVEDGFLRSRGLGARLVPPLSLVTDDLGIYYDPSRESRLERLISDSTRLPPFALQRAARLISRLAQTGLSKYSVGQTTLPELPAGRRILVPGQVEDDASVRLGCTDIRTNLDLLRETRAQNPNAVILFKPHPDVEAGLRPGAVADEAALQYADMIITDTDPIALISACDEIWTMTSLLGFEALIRGKSVTCLGVPFYAGWGLTRDRAPVPERRKARPTQAGLVHAALIDYPRYRDPVSGNACPVEVVVDRLAEGDIARPGPINRLASKLQGIRATIRR